MELDHERLDVYQLALDFLMMANGIIEAHRADTIASRRKRP
jgi:hypothetical protein